VEAVWEGLRGRHICDFWKRKRNIGVFVLTKPPLRYIASFDSAFLYTKGIPTNTPLNRSAPTSSTNRSPSSTVCTPSAAPASKNGSPFKRRLRRPSTHTPARHVAPRCALRSPMRQSQLY
jgi:hypothetical protein